jgi:hypothetical protein
MKLTKEEILRLLEKLNASLAKEEIHGELYLMGGAVMCIAFDARDSTKDLDCFFKPSRLIREKAKEIALEEGLSDDWLNDGVKGFLTEKAQFHSFLDCSHLRVLICTPEYLLAMKCLAMRLGEEFHDENDVRFLLRYLNIESCEKAVELLTKFYPKEKYPQKTFHVLEEILLP